MAATTQPSVFTNTRLMLAGVILGALGVIFAFLYVQSRVSQEIGEKITIYYLTKNLNTNETLNKSFIGEIEVPAALAQVAANVVKGREITRVMNSLPLRKMEKGEILLFNNFQNVSGKVQNVVIPRGCVLKTIEVDTRNSPGKLLNIGTFVSIIGNFEFGERNSASGSDRVSGLRILRAVQVRAIDGEDNPDIKQQKNPRSINIVVGEETAALLTALRDKQDGKYDIEIMPADTTKEAAPNKEMPEGARTMVVDKLKQHGVAIENADKTE